MSAWRQSTEFPRTALSSHPFSTICSPHISYEKMNDNTMVGNLEELLIIPINSKQIREERGKILSLLPAGLSGCLFNCATAESVSRMRYLQFVLISDH